MTNTNSLKERFQKARNTKSVRLIVLGILLAILIALYFFRGKSKGLLLVLIVVTIGAFGLQLTDYDLDLETLWNTGSIQESRVELKKGMKIIGSECVADTVNCSNFATQAEAQAKYEACAAKISADNDGKDAKSLDVYGLDKDKDGIVCEHLAK